MNLKIFFISILIATTYFKSYTQTDSLYLGQTPAGSTPQIFELETSPGYFVCDRLTFSADGKEIIYSETKGGDWSNCKIKQYTYFENQWHGPTILFTGAYHAPSLSNNDSILFCETLSSTYYSERTETGWSPLEEFPKYYSYLQQTASGNYYASVFNSVNSLGSLDIAKVSFEALDTTMGTPINTSSWEAGFCISKDESIIVFGTGSIAGSLLISVKTDDNQWTDPIALDETINTSADESGAYISKDNKYLFFSRYNWDYTDGFKYWVNIESIIEILRQSSNIIDNKSDEDHLLVFPNPANQTIQIITYLLPEILNYQILDLNGKLVKQDKFDSKIIDVSRLNQGVYILKLQTDNGLINKKIVIE